MVARHWLLLMMLFASAARAAGKDECPHGQLDARYCDQDGDLVADVPTDPAQFVNPDTLIFAYTPVEKPAVYKKIWQPFLDHLKQVTGKAVTYYPVQSNAAEIELMRTGRLHIAAFNSGSVPLAVNAAGFVPRLMMAQADGSFGYELEVVVRANDQMKAPKDLRGKMLAFTSPTSTLGFKAPAQILEREFKLRADRDYQAAYSGKHDSSLLGVLNRDYDAAVVPNVVWRRMIDRGVLKANALRSIYKSATFPSTAYGTAHNLDPALAAKIDEAFRSFDWTGSLMLQEYQYGEGTKFVPIDYATLWAPVRVIDTALGVDSLAKP